MTLHPYLTTRPLPLPLQPCVVRRHDRGDDRLFVVAMHPGTPRWRAWQWMTDHLATDELDAIRAGFGIGPVGLDALPDHFLDGPVRASGAGLYPVELVSSVVALEGYAPPTAHAS